MIGEIGQGNKTLMRRRVGKFVTFSVINAVTNLLVFILTIGVVGAVDLAADPMELLPADLQFERPSDAKMAALLADTTLDEAHKRKLRLFIYLEKSENS